MRQLIIASIKNPMVVNIFVALVIAAGAFVTINIQRDFFPAFAPDRIGITVPFPGAGAEEVEEGVTIKIEEAVQGINGIDYVQSTSAEGVSSVMLALKSSVKNPRKVLDDVKDAVDQIYTFPDDAEEPKVILAENRDSVIYVAVSGDVDEMTLKSVGEEIKDDLLELGPVSDVRMDGVRALEISINVSEESLQRYGMTFGEIAQAVRNFDLDISGGTIKTDAEELSIRAKGNSYRAEEIAAIPVRTAVNGTILRIRDVADVKEGFEDRSYKFRYNGKPGMTLLVMKTEQEDLLEVAYAVKAYVEEKAPIMTEGLTMETFMDRSVFLNQRIGLLLKNAGYAMLLIALLLLIFLGPRLSLWIVFGLPVAVMGSIVLINWQGVTINMMSLFAFILVLGILVDDAIVVGESIQQHIEKGKDPEQAAIDGTVDVYPAVIGSVLTTMAAFAPFYFVEGMFGNFVYPIAVVVILGLACSLVEALFILPAHLAHSLSSMEERKTRAGIMDRMVMNAQEMFMSLVDKTYRPVVKFAVKHHWEMFLVGFCFFAISMSVVKSGVLRFVFFPNIDSDWLQVTYTLEPGSSMVVHDAVAEHINDKLMVVGREYQEKRAELLKTPEGKKFGKTYGPDAAILRRVVVTEGGTNEASLPMEGGAGATPETGEIFAEMIDGESRGISSAEMIERWRQLVGEVPGVKKMNFDASAGPPGSNNVEVQLLGDDMEELIKASVMAKNFLRDFQGVYQIQDDLSWGRREMRLKLNDRGRALGLTYLDLASQVRQGFYGQEVKRIQRGRDEIKVWIRYPKAERNSMSDFENVRIRTRAGDEVPLMEVVEIENSRQLRAISRYERKRKINVSCKVNTDLVEPSKILDALKAEMPSIAAQVSGVEYKFEGSNRAQMQMMRSMMMGFLVALIGIFIIIALVFKNYAHSLMIMMIIPMGFVGAVLGHLIIPFMNHNIARMDMSFLSVTGLVALAGIVVNDSIVMIHAIKGNIAEGMPFREAVVEGASSRFRPIILTTLTTSGGMMPLIMEKSLQAQFLIPMAAAIAFGLLFGTFFTQVWLPSTMVVFNDVKRGWYLVAKGTLYTDTDVERNALPEGGSFIRGLFPGHLAGLTALMFVIAFAISKFLSMR